MWIREPVDPASIISAYCKDGLLGGGMHSVSFASLLGDPGGEGEGGEGEGDGSIRQKSNIPMEMIVNNTRFRGNKSSDFVVNISGG